jgi:flagellar motility protein MotE (MotC chaperone)
MKKAIILCEVLVIAFVVVKLVSISGLMSRTDGMGIAPWFLGKAGAESALRGQGTPQDVDEQLVNERKLLASLTERQKQIDSREVFLKAEEKRLDDLKREIVQKIETLKALEEKLTAPLEANVTADDKKFKDLAKVYEATPAQQVGTILEKMDTKTAAGILMNMNAKKAGVIWGHIAPSRSVEIANEITAQQKK